MRRAAIGIMEAGNLLMVPIARRPPVEPNQGLRGRVGARPDRALVKKDCKSFDGFAQALRNLGWEALRASDNQNAALLLEIGDRMQPVCAGCHQHSGIRINRINRQVSNSVLSLTLKSLSMSSPGAGSPSFGHSTESYQSLVCRDGQTMGCPWTGRSSNHRNRWLTSSQRESWGYWMPRFQRGMTKKGNQALESDLAETSADFGGHYEAECKKRHRRHRGRGQEGPEPPRMSASILAGRSSPPRSPMRPSTS